MDSSLKETYVPFLKHHWLPILLGIVGLSFLGYGLINQGAPKSDKKDILFEAATDQNPIAEGKSSETKSRSVGQITIDIEGGVLKPGVYSLPSDSRIQDALIAAGGMSQSADRTVVSKMLNLAAKLADGGKIYIPIQGDQGNSSLASGQQNVMGADANSLININTASEKDLDSLPGVGAVTAQKIISNRPYTNLSELVQKKVVGQKVFDQIKDKISI